MQYQFINSITVDDDRLSDGFFESFIQHFVQSHAVQLSIYILSWCLEVLLVCQERYYMLAYFNSTVQEQCIRVLLMLNQFRYCGYDFTMHILKVMCIKTHYNVAGFVMHLENIFIWVSSCDRYSQKKLHTLRVVGRLPYKTSSIMTMPMKCNEVEHSNVIGGGGS